MKKSKKQRKIKTAKAHGKAIHGDVNQQLRHLIKRKR